MTLQKLGYPRSNNTTADLWRPMREHHLITGIIMRKCTNNSIPTCYKWGNVNNRPYRLMRTSSIAVEMSWSTSRKWHYHKTNEQSSFHKIFSTNKKGRQTCAFNAQPELLYELANVNKYPSLIKILCLHFVLVNRGKSW